MFSFTGSVGGNEKWEHIAKVYGLKGIDGTTCQINSRKVVSHIVHT